MGPEGRFGLTLLLLAFLLSPVAATHSDVSVGLNKSAYCTSDGYLGVSGRVLTHDGTAPGAGKNVTLDLYHSASAESKQFLQSTVVDLVPSTGNFTNDTLAVPAGTQGKHFIQATYVGTNKNWTAKVTFLVLPKCVDSYTASTDKSVYAPGEKMVLTGTALRKVQGVTEGVPGLNPLELRVADGDGATVYSGTCGPTDSAGSCNVTATAPASAGTYWFDVNNSSTTSFQVLPFEVSTTPYDSKTKLPTVKFAPGDTLRISVAVTVGGNPPTSGTYTVMANSAILSEAGSLVKNYGPITLTGAETSPYVGSADITLKSADFPNGNYKIVTNVSSGASTVSAFAYFTVTSYTLELLPLKNGGFLPGSTTAFTNTEVRYGARLISANKTSVNVTGSGGSVNGAILDAQGNPLPIPVGNSSNSSLVTAEGTTVSGYRMNFTTPAAPGTYTLNVNATYQNRTYKETVVFRVTNLFARAVPVDGKGQGRQAFNGREYLYLNVSLYQSVNGVPVEIPATSILLKEVRNATGNAFAYAQNDNWQGDDLAKLEWRNNTTPLVRLKLDNPGRGGDYTAVLFVANGANETRARAAIRIEPYCVSLAWGENRFQYSTQENVTLRLNVQEASYGQAQAGNGGGGPQPATGGGGGFGDCPGSQAVSGATVTFLRLNNDRSNQPLNLDNLTVVCTSTDSSGSSTCTLAPAGGKWSTGFYSAELLVTGSDGVSTGNGYAFFEVREFYIWAFPINPADPANFYWWFNRTANVSFRVKMYDAFGGGFDPWAGGGAQGGLKGKVQVNSIFYHGTAGEWLWPPVELPYSGTLPNATINGTGTGLLNLTVPMNGSNVTGWKPGIYSVALQGTTDDGRVDYGEGWFEVRIWDAGAWPVDAEALLANSGESLDWKDAYLPNQSVTLYINIRNLPAQPWLYTPPGENLTCQTPPPGLQFVEATVKRITDFSSWPPRDVDSSIYTASPAHLSVSTSAGNPQSPKKPSEAVWLKLQPDKKWPSGWYSVVLDLHGNPDCGNETAWGWFQIRPFYATAQMVNAQNVSVWQTKGAGPLWLNVTTTRNQPWWPPSCVGCQPWVPLDAAGPIPTTIQEMALNSFSMATESFRRLNMSADDFPDNFSAGRLFIPGQANVSLTYQGNPALRWPSGWYSGTVTLNDSNGDAGSTWLGFEVRPFVLLAQTVDNNGMPLSEVPSNSPVRVNLTFRDPDLFSWSDPQNASSLLAGAFTVESVKDQRWFPFFSETSVTYDKVPPATVSNSGGGNITLSPPGGAWSSGWNNLRVVAKDSQGGTAEGWAWFNAVPYRASVLCVKEEGQAGCPGVWPVNVDTGKKVLVQVRLENPTDMSDATGHLAKVSENWPVPRTFASPNSTVTGTQWIEVNPSGTDPGAWDIGSHSLSLQFTEGPEIWASFNAVGLQGNAWPASWAYNKDQPVFFNFSSPAVTKGGQPVCFSVAGVRTVNWKESGYAPNFVTVSPGRLHLSNATTANVTGDICDPGVYLRVDPPDGGWTKGDYGAEITVQSGASKGEIWPWFNIVVPGLAFSYPLGGEQIKGFVQVNANTFDDPNCDAKEVRFYYNAGPVYTDADTLIGNYSTQWCNNGWGVGWSIANLSAGAYKLRAKALSGAGVEVASAETGEVTVLDPSALPAAFSGAYSWTGRYANGTAAAAGIDVVQARVGLLVRTGGFYSINGCLYGDDWGVWVGCNWTTFNAPSYNFYAPKRVSSTSTPGSVQLPNNTTFVIGDQDVTFMGLTGSDGGRNPCAAGALMGQVNTQTQASGPFSITLNVTTAAMAGLIPGPYTLVCNGESNGTVTALSVPPPQTAEAVLEFDGKPLASGGYVNKNLTLTGLNLQTALCCLNLDWRDRAVLGTFDSSQFHAPGAKFTAKPPVTADYPTDVNGGGFDFLNATVEVQINEPGTYTLTADLYSNVSWQPLAPANNSTTYGAPGVVQVNLTFPGGAIRSAGLPPGTQLYLRNIRLWNATPNPCFFPPFPACNGAPQQPLDQWWEKALGLYGSAQFDQPKGERGVLAANASYSFMPGVWNRMSFGASPTLADLDADGLMEIVTGSDEYANCYPELNWSGPCKYANGIWRVFDSSLGLLGAKDTRTDEARTSVAVADVYGGNSTVKRFDQADNPSPGADIATSVVVDSTGNIYVGGWYNVGGSDDGGRLVKLPPNGGAAVWDYKFPGQAGWDRIYALALDNGGNVYAAMEERLPGESRWNVTKFSPAGGVVWTYVENPSPYTDAPQAIAVNSTGYVFVAGYDTKTAGGNDNRWNLRAITPAGAAAWNYSVNQTTGADQVNAIAVDGGDNIYLAGVVDLFGDGSWNVTKLGPTGSKLWSWTENPSGNADEPKGIAVDGAGNAYVAGYETVGGSDTQWRVRQLNADGTAGWLYTSNPGGAQNRAQAVALDPDGGLWVAGYDEPAGSGSARWRVQKLAPGGVPDGAYADPPQVNGSDARAIAIDSLGQMVVAGTGYTGAGVDYQWRVLKMYNSREIVGGTTSGWNMEVWQYVNSTTFNSSNYLWTFPSPPATGGSFLWHSSPAVSDLNASLPGLEIVAGNNPYGSVWAFKGAPNGVDDGPSKNTDTSWYWYGAGKEGKDWDVLWKFDTGGSVIATAAMGNVSGDSRPEVVIGSDDGKLYAINGTTGQKVWQYDAGTAYVSDLGTKGIESSAAIADFDGDGQNEVVVGTATGNVVVIRGDLNSDGVISGSSEVAAFATGGPVLSSPAVGNTTPAGGTGKEIVVGSDDGKVYALRWNPGTNTVSQVWSFATGGAVRSSPALAARNDSQAAGNKRDVYVGSEDGYLYLLNGTDGSLVDRFQGPGPLRTSPSVADIDNDGKLEVVFVSWRAPDVLWLVEDTGSNLSPGAARTPWPTFRHDAARTGVVLP